MYAGNERELIRRIIKGEYINHTSKELVWEFSRVIVRNKFGLNAKERERMIKTLLDSSILTETKTRITAVKEDPADNKVLECAVGLAGRMCGLRRFALAENR
jgi:predicted nucleic acid-binding protein